jgi:cell division protein FtsQ
VTQTLDAPTGSDESTAVDPRIQARRDQVEQDRTRRRRRRLVVVAAVLGAVALAWLLVRSPLLSVRHVVAKGTPHVPVSEVRTVAGLHDGQRLVGLDTGAAERRLMALPWVATARVSTSWDGTVRIAVTERRPVAAVAQGVGRWMLVDAAGRALGLAPRVPPGVIAIRGRLPHVRAGQQYGASLRAPLQVVAVLHPGLRTRVAAVLVPTPGALELALRPGGVADLCSAVDLRDKLFSLTTVFAHVDDTDLASVDVCIPDTPRITRVAVAPPPAATSSTASHASTTTSTTLPTTTTTAGTRTGTTP